MIKFIKKGLNIKTPLDLKLANNSNKSLKRGNRSLMTKEKAGEDQ